MTPSQIEAASRHYINAIGLNPDEMCRLDKPQVGANGPIDKMERWRFIAPAILDQSRLIDAIKAARDSDSS